MDLLQLQFSSEQQNAMDIVWMTLQKRLGKVENRSSSDSAGYAHIGFTGTNNFHWSRDSGRLFVKRPRGNSMMK